MISCSQSSNLILRALVHFMSKLFRGQLICTLEDQLADGEGTSLERSTVWLIDALFEEVAPKQRVAGRHGKELDVY